MSQHSIRQHIVLYAKGHYVSFGQMDPPRDIGMMIDKWAALAPETSQNDPGSLWYHIWRAFCWSFARPANDRFQLAVESIIVKQLVNKDEGRSRVLWDSMLAQMACNRIDDLPARLPKPVPEYWGFNIEEE